MLAKSAAEKSAAELQLCWREARQIVHLPDELRPSTRTEGYAIQSRLEDEVDSPVAGWKIAATSAAGQAHINVDGPLAGRIFAERLVENDAEIPLIGNNMRVAELEFAFRLGTDLAPRDGGYSVEEVHAAVAALHPAIEIPASRYSDFTAVGAPALIADNSCAHLFLFGPEFARTDWQDRDLRTWEVTADIPGKGTFTGIGSNVLGDPWAALDWLVNECSTHGMALKEGQSVSTGTCLVPVAVEEGDRLTADFGAGPPLTLKFT